MSQKTACEIIESQTDDYVRFPMSVQLVKSSNLRQMFMSVFPCPFSLWNYRISDRWIMSVFPCPFSLWNHQISDRWIMSVYTLMFLRTVLPFHSHFRLHLRSSVDVFTFPHWRGLLCRTLLSCHLFLRLKEIQKRCNAVLMRQLLRHVFCASSLNNILQALT